MDLPRRESLRVEIAMDAGIVGLGETVGGQRLTNALEKPRASIVGRSIFAIRGVARELRDLHEARYSGIEVAWRDARGKATGRRLVELPVGQVGDPVPSSAYLASRYPADPPVILADPNRADRDAQTRRRGLDAEA